MSGYLSNFAGKRYYVTLPNGQRRQISGLDAWTRVHGGLTFQQQVNKAMHAKYGGSVFRNALARARRNKIQSAYNRTKAANKTRNAAATMKASWQSAYNKAKAANKAREKELRTKYKQRYSAVMQGLQHLGDADRAAILQRNERQKGQAEQSAISRGLSMGTVVDSLKNSVQEGTNQALGQLDESIRRTKLGYESQLRKEEADFIERIQDQYPDQRLYAGMFQQHGQGVAATGQSNLSATGGYAGQFGVGHAFYQGPNNSPSRTLNRWQHHQFSNPRPRRRGGGSSMSAKARKAARAWAQKRPALNRYGNKNTYGVGPLASGYVRPGALPAFGLNLPKLF